jgi:hypothetical protein
VRAWYAGASSKARTAALAIVVPIAVWMLAPSHMRGFVGFLENRDSGPSVWTLDGLLYYPRAFLHDFSPSPSAGAACLVLAFAAALLWRRLPLTTRVVAVALAIALAGTLAHPYKLPRFLFPVVPLVWLTAGGTLATALDLLVGDRLRGVVASLGPPVLLIAAMLIPVDAARIAEDPGTRGVNPHVRPAVQAVARIAAGAHRSVLVGYWDDFSPGLVDWEGWQTVPGWDAGDVPRPADHVLRDAPAARLPEVAVRDDTVREILVLELRPGASAWREGWARETGWLDAARRALEVDPHWRLRSREPFLESGYELLAYERRPTS